ncbi:hypothetical protein BBF96_02680 [Anoxybacter fermentans]|uniref:Ribosomal protein eL8/eL30/eS12/Gadd45 domain-containing protein n=1 Tax=Anoxybacter fermentans TaxID=1323375 RepID=A0A3S9SVU6_9FIRM|nr:ribosomal L7Ae/L30e/S12e/Gadd45 family protein [Anoxybacter fermentans]AZR72392.1 hypothetical protein BBF96_02680 [Anoxybacter fermentans]
MKNDKRIVGMLGLAQKAGKISSGAFQVEKDIKKGRAYLVIVATDASANTLKDFRDSCKYYKVPFRVWGDKETLGHSIGKPFRAVVAVRDQGFAARLKELLGGEVDDENFVGGVVYGKNSRI